MSRLPTSVPAAAMFLLDFIGDIEAPQGYGTIYGNNQRKLPVPLERMTFGDIVDSGKEWTKLFKSSAAGRYQFMRATLQSLAIAYPQDIKGDLRFDRFLQDRLGYALLLRRGFAEFVSGSISKTEFGKRLAQEWASIPVLTSCKGAHRELTRGQSFYAGDALNKSLVKPSEVETVLDKVLNLHNSSNTQLPPPIIDAVPVQQPSAKEGWIVLILNFLIRIFGGK